MFIFHPLYFLAQIIQPLLAPICLIAAWAFLVLLAWSAWTMIRDTAKQAVHLHQIPCANCQFFTGDYHLKCTVHPSRALSEAAIDCRDYRAKTNPFTASSTSLSKNDQTDLAARLR